MNRTLGARLAKAEAAHAGPPPVHVLLSPWNLSDDEAAAWFAVERASLPPAARVVRLPADAWEGSGELRPDVLAAAFAAHRAATGYTGPVLLAPVCCETSAEWTAVYGRRVA